MAIYQLDSKLAQVAYLAGYLEGEGWFGLIGGRYPCIDVSATDEDVVRNVGYLLHSLSIRRRAYTGVGKPVWRTCICGAHAAGWMMTLYPLLGHRRRARIRDVLAVWRSRPATCRPWRKRVAA